MPATHPTSSLRLLFVLIAAVLLSRLPFTANEPYTIDSYNFTLAVEHYAPLEDMPHFPGYFFYVMPAKALYLLTGNANSALVGWSVILSLLTTALMFRFAQMTGVRMLHLRREEARRFAVISTVLLMVNPVLWFYGETALSYILGGVVGICGTWAILAEKRHRWQWLLPPMLLGWFIGMRLEAAALLFFFAYRAWKERLPMRWWLFSALAFLFGVGLWLIPTQLASGSAEAFWARGIGLITRTSEHYAEENGFVIRLARFAAILIYTVGAGVIPLVFLPRTMWGRMKQLPRSFVTMLLWWTVPVVLPLAVLFLRPAYCVMIAPAFTLAIAAMVIPLSRKRQVVIVAVAAALSTAYFLFPQLGGKTALFTAARIRWSDTRTQTERRALASRISNHDAAILCYAEFYTWQAAMTDFPNARSYQIFETSSGRGAVEGFHTREHDVRASTSGDLFDLPSDITEIAVVRDADDPHLSEDFPSLQLTDSLPTEYGTLYFATRKERMKAEG